MPKNKEESVQEKKRKDLRERLFVDEERPWLGHQEIGYFCASRTLPLLLTLLKSKDLSGKDDPGRVYVELLSRHKGQGIVEMTHQEEHAFASGYQGNRATHTWRERMKALEELGFIKTKSKGNSRYAYVLLVHPTIVVQQLRDDGKIPDEWWTSFTNLQIDTREPTAQVLISQSLNSN